MDVLAGHGAFRQAVKQLAEGAKTDPPFEVVQGGEMLKSHGA
jgi:hypothetical protein